MSASILHKGISTLVLWIRNRILQILSICTLLFLWYLLSNINLVPSVYMPSPQMVVRMFNNHLSEMPTHIYASMIRIILGFGLGSALGFVMGLLLSWNKTVAALSDPIIEFVRPIPPLAIIPLMILWFGIGDMAKILLIAFGCWVILVVDTAEAVRNVNPLFVNAARCLGASKFDILRTITIPAITPNIIGGIRVAAAVSFGMNVASEFMGTRAGFGYLIIEGRRFIQTDLIVVGILMITFFSMLANTAIRIIEKQLTKWVERVR
jgi:ABC-type nitrate/sulfonate/bicarbonate transport system permease component